MKQKDRHFIIMVNTLVPLPECHTRNKGWEWLLFQLRTHKLYAYQLIVPYSSGFLELQADLVEAAVAHCQLIVVSK